MQILVSIIAISTLVAFIVDVRNMIQLAKVAYLNNDKSRDYSRWTLTDLAIAAYISRFADKEVRLDNHFQAVVYAVLRRSERAVDEKIRRMSSISSPKSDASVADVEAFALVLSYREEEAKDMFILDLLVSGASKKQIEVLRSYLSL